MSQEYKLQQLRDQCHQISIALVKANRELRDRDERIELYEKELQTLKNEIRVLRDQAI